MLRAHVVEKIGAIARPRVIIFTDDLPKTRSGKIMRRLLRDVAEGRDLGDTTTLADPAVVAELRRRARGRLRRGMSTGADHPGTWTWRAGAKAAGPAVIFDIDGVLADASGRQHHLAGLRRDWDAFFAACGEDPHHPGGRPAARAAGARARGDPAHGPPGARSGRRP